MPRDDEQRGTKESHAGKIANHTSNMIRANWFQSGFYKASSKWTIREDWDTTCAGNSESDHSKKLESYKGQLHGMNLVNRLCSIELNKETKQDHFVTDASPEEVKKRLKKVGEQIWDICETQQLPSLAERMVPDQNMAKKNAKNKPHNNHCNMSLHSFIPAEHQKTMRIENQQHWLPIFQNLGSIQK